MRLRESDEREHCRYVAPLMLIDATDCFILFICCRVTRDSDMFATIDTDDAAARVVERRRAMPPLR